MNFWHLLTTSRYTRRLEAENGELKARIAEYEKILIPRLAFVGGSVAASVERAQPVRAGESLEDRAESGKSAVRPGRKGWQWSRARLEELHNPENGKQVRL